jgi:hypothetical protein
MKYLIVFAVFISVYSHTVFHALAQDDINPSTSTTPIGATSNLSTQSNAVCVKVGNPSEDQKPAACSAKVPGGGGPRPEAPPAEGDIRGAILEQFGVSMNGYDRQRLQWTWEKLWEVSNTNFVELVRGSVVQVTSTSNSHQVGCPGAAVAVYLGPFNDEYTFKQAFAHELGHVIANCSTKRTAHWQEYLNAHRTEGGVSHYGRNAESCTGSDSISEDFAEMIAFYLNPGVATTIVACNRTPEQVNMAADFPMHFEVAKAILGVF